LGAGWERGREKADGRDLGPPVPPRFFPLAAVPTLGSFSGSFQSCSLLRMLHLASATMESGSPRMLFSSDRDEFTATKKKKLSGRARIRISSGRFRSERASGRREVGRLTESLARKEMRPRCHEEEGEAAALSRGGSIARKKEAAAAPSPAGSTLGSIGVKRIRTLDAPLLNGPNRFSPLAKTRSGSTS